MHIDISFVLFNLYCFKKISFVAFNVIKVKLVKKVYGVQKYIYVQQYAIIIKAISTISYLNGNRKSHTSYHYNEKDYFFDKFKKIQKVVFCKKQI